MAYDSTSLLKAGETELAGYSSSEFYSRYGDLEAGGDAAHLDGSVSDGMVGVGARKQRSSRSSRARRTRITSSSSSTSVRLYENWSEDAPSLIASTRDFDAPDADDDGVGAGGDGGHGSGGHGSQPGDDDEYDDDETADVPINRPKPPMTVIVREWLKEYMAFEVSLVVVVALMLLGIFVIWPPWTDEALGWKAWFSIGSCAVTLLLLLVPWFPPSFVLLLSMTSLMAVRIITVNEALAGFSNTGVATVAVLFIVAKSVEESKALNLVIKYILRKPTTILSAQLRLLFPVAFFSAFLNNTPIVAMMIPVVESWSVKCKIPQSMLLMPLSFAAILGGSCSIIGTSTNVIVLGLAQEADPTIELGFFEIALVGLPTTLIGILYMLLTSRFLLPLTTSPTEALMNQPREYTASVVIRTGSEVIGKTIEDAGLHDLGVVLFQLRRRLVDASKFSVNASSASNSASDDNSKHEASADDESKPIRAANAAPVVGQQMIMQPEPDTVLQAGDVLYFAGVVEAMQRVYDIPGLVPATAELSKLTVRRSSRALVETVLAAHAPFIGKTLRQARFRTEYSAVVIAIHRKGERIQAKLKDITLQGGDTLLLEAERSFLTNHRNDSNFSLIHEIADYSVLGRYRLWRMVFVCLIALAMVVVSTVELIDLFSAALVATCVYILTKCITMNSALDSVKGDLLLIIAAAFGLGVALEKTGAAKALADVLVSIFSPAGKIGVLFGLYFATAVMSSVISNAATVTLMFPIGWSFVQSGELTQKAVIYTLMLAGSCCFSTPIGYQTNIMVTGPGGYQPVDFFKFGGPLTILSTIVGVLLCYFIFQY